MKSESTTLYFKRGSSDKEYTVRLLSDVDHSDRYNVTYAYGRRGGPQTCRTKNTEALHYEPAKALYSSMIHAKQLKGYTADGEAIAFADNPNAGEDTGFRPQLLNEVTLEDAEDFYLTNMPSVAVQTKWDGERRAAILKKGIPNTFTNRKGQAKGIRDTIDTACTELIEGRPLIHSFQLDCEDMGEYLVIFDILSVNEIDMTGKSFAERAESLSVLDCMITHAGLEKYIRVEQPTYPTSLKEFRWLIEHARAHNEEGVVIRLASAPYEPGKPATGGPCLKYKFIGEATCMVIGDVEGKRSMEIAVRSNSFPSAPIYVPVGKVTIPPNYEMPEIGDLVEVRYMNIMKGDGAKLFQPRYKGLRTDKTKADLYSSLKFKKED